MRPSLSRVGFISIISLFSSVFLSNCASSIEISPVTDGELVLYFSEPFNVAIETVAEEVARAGMGISNAGLKDPSTYQILVIEEQRMAIGNSNTSNNPITVGTAEILFRLNKANNVEMKLLYKPVDKRGGNTESKIGTGEFARLMKKRLDSRLTIVSGEAPSWN